MAVFLVNGCKFKGCSLVFETLAELIQHVEEAHIELDPKLLEKQENDQPTSVALSHVLKFYAGAKPRKSLLAISTKKNRQRNNSVMSTSASIRSLTPTSSEHDFDDDDADSYTGLDSEPESKGALTPEQQWTNQLILSMISNKTDDDDKPYACRVKGCKKRYKNINGVKYHARHGHKREARMAKFTSKCFCGKSFHSVKQLEQHTRTEHSLSNLGISSLTEIEQVEGASSASTTATVTKKEHVGVAVSTVEGKGPLSIIHPITISGGVLLTPATTRHLKTVSKGEILVSHKLATSSVHVTRPTMASLVTAASNLVTPPTTPLKKTTLNSGSKLVCTTESDELNEKVAKALAAAKKAMEAAAKETQENQNSQRTTVVTSH